MNRWEALVRFDDEIREAAEELIPYGVEWVDQLGQAFFALNEDRSYLPNIVERLRREAQFAGVHRWLERFRICSNGEVCSQEALDVLVKSTTLGYEIGIERGVFTICRGEAKSFLYSNADILRYDQFLK
jgi:hypothetical protein